MFVIILFICLSVNVNCDINDEGKYIDLLPEAEKREFLERVARRILEEVETKKVAKEPSVTLKDAKLDDTSSFVSKLLNEEAADLKRRNMNWGHNKTKDRSKSSLRGGDNEKEKYIDLTLRGGPHQLQLKQGNITEQEEHTTSLIITVSGVGKESTTGTTEEAVTALPEKVIVDVIKTNDLPLIGIDNVTEIKKLPTSIQVVTASSPIEDITKRNFRRHDEKIDIQKTIDDANDTISPKIKASEELTHVVYEDNLNKSKSVDTKETNKSKSSNISSILNSAPQNKNSIQDDTKSSKMRANEEAVHLVQKDNINKSIPVDTNKSNKSISSELVISTPNIVNQSENVIQDSINRKPNLTQDNENETTSTQQKPLRNDRDIRELAKEGDEFQDNSRRREVNLIPEEDENDKEVNVLPDDEVEVVNQKNTQSNESHDIPKVLVTIIDTPGVTVASTITSESIVARVDTEKAIMSTEIPEVIATSTDAPKVTVSSIDGLEVSVTIKNALDNAVTSTEPVNIIIIENSKLTENNVTANQTTGLFNFRASDIIWPQAYNSSLVRVFDTAIVVNKTEVTTTEENIIESLKDVKLISVINRKPGENNTVNPDGQKNFRRNVEKADTTTLAPEMLSVKANIPEVQLGTVSNVDSKIPENRSRINEDYPVTDRTLYSHASPNKDGGYSIIVEENPLSNVTQETHSGSTSEATKSTTQELLNASLNEDGGHSVINKEKHLREVSQKPDSELSYKNTKPTTQEIPYYFRGNDTIFETPTPESEVIHHSQQPTTNTTAKYQQPPLQSFESVTQVRTTPELDIPTTGKIDDLTSNMENAKVELIKKKKKAHKAKIESVFTSQTEGILESISENEAQTISPLKALINANEYPLAIAQADETKTPEVPTVSPNEARDPLQGFTDNAKSELIPNISDDNQRTTTEVQLISVMSTKTKSSSTNPINSVHVERRIGEYESIDSEEPITISSTERIESTVSETAVDSITIESVRKVTSDRISRLVSEAASETVKYSANKLASEGSDETATKPPYDSASKKFDVSASEFLTERTTKSAIKTFSEVNNDTVSKSASEPTNDRASGLASILATESNTEIYSMLPSEENKAASNLASTRPSELASETKSETTSKIINESRSESVTELLTELETTEKSSDANNEAFSEPPSNYVSERNSQPDNEMTSKSASESANELISEPIQDSELASKLGNETISKSTSESANEPISESISIKPTSQSIPGVQSEVIQSTKNTNKADKLKEGTTLQPPSPLTPPTSPTSDQNSQIEKPVDKTKHNLEFIHVTTDKIVVDTTEPKIQVTTTVIPLLSTDNGDIEVKTKKLDVESTSRNYDSSEIMTKVPTVTVVYVPNIAKNNKSKHVQNSKLSLQLGLVPEEPVTEKKIESLIKFHTTQVMKEYSVYEIRKYIIINYMKDFRLSIPTFQRSGPWLKRILT